MIRSSASYRQMENSKLHSLSMKFSDKTSKKTKKHMATVIDMIVDKPEKTSMSNIVFTPT